MYGGSGEPQPLTQSEAERMFSAYQQQNLSQTRMFVIAALAWHDGRACGDDIGLCIGGIRLHSIAETDRRARLAIGIFDRRFWSHGYGTEAIRLLLAYAFSTMGLHRVDLRVLAYNTRAIRAYEKCGFIREGIERESALVDGVWHDDIIMSVLEHEFHAPPA